MSTIKSVPVEQRSLLQPTRYSDESYEEYQKRRKLSKVSVKNHLKGKPIQINSWNMIKIIYLGQYFS